MMDYCVPKELATAKPPSTWGRLSIAPDQGGDGIAAYNFLTREMHCCADLTPDPSHGSNNDIWQLFQDLGVKSQMLLWLIAFNIPMGPYQSDARFQEVRCVLDDLFSNCDPASTPLFLAMAPAMLQDEEFKDLEAADDPTAALWERLSSESPWKTKGTKMVKSRFMAFTRKARVEVGHLGARGFGYLLACIETRFVTDKSLDKMPILNLSGEVGIGMGTTSSTLETVEEKAVRRTGANNMMLGALVYNNEDSAKLLRAMLELVAPVEVWHTNRNKVLRKAENSATWMIDQLCGHFFACLQHIVRMTKSQRSLVAVPFSLPKAGRAVEDAEMDWCFSFQEDHLATIFADGALVLCALRFQRQLWLLRGWRSRLSLVLKNDSLGSMAVECLRKDYANFQRLSERTDLAGVQDIVDRCCFRLAAVKQDIAMRVDRS